MPKIGILFLLVILWAFIDIVELRREYQVPRKEISLGGLNVRKNHIEIQN